MLRRALISTLMVLALVGCAVSAPDSAATDATNNEDADTATDADTAEENADDADAGDAEVDENDSEVAQDRLVIAQNSDLKTLDPHNASERPAERVNRNVYSRLFTRTENNEIVPEIVTDYDQVDDETWHFTLRDDVIFSNGDALTAADVEYSLTRVSTDETLLEQTRWVQVAEVTELDDHEVEIVTGGPMPTLLNLLSKSGGDILPADYIDEHGIDEFIQAPIGSGPYQVVQWDRDSQVLLEPSPEYYGDEPQWQEVIVRAVPEGSTRTSELATGGVDFITDVPPIEWDRLESEEEIQLVHGESSRVLLLIVRLTEGEGYPTEDERVREAIDLAVDNQAIVDSLLPDGVAVPARSRAPEGVFGSHPDLYDAYVHDMERAQELVAEAGEGEPIELRMTASRGRYPLDAEVAELTAAMLEEAGFSVDLTILEGGAFSDVYSNHTNDELLMIALADAMLDASYSLNHYQNDRAAGQTDYHNEEVEELMHEANRTMDEDERERLYHEVQEIVVEERPHIPMLQLNPTYGMRSDLEWEPTLDEALIFDHITPAG